MPSITQATTAPAANDCQLSVVAGQPMTAAYTDINDSADTVSANAPVVTTTAGLFLSIAASRSAASVGEAVPFQIDLTNTTGVGITGSVATVALPTGFRYQPGSTTLDGSPVGDPAVSADGRTLTFSVGVG